MLQTMLNLIKIISSDLEGVQNISSMFDKGELKIGKLHVTDDAKFDKKIISSDLEGITKNLEGVQNISSMFDKGELKIAKLHVTDDAKFDKQIRSKNLHVQDHAQFDKTLKVNQEITSKNLHAIDDVKFDKKIISSDLEGITKNLEGVQSISSMIDKGEFKIAKLHVTDDAQFDKNIKVNEKMTSKNLHVDDYSSTKRLDVRNNGTFSFTHFNYNNEGKNYYRGKNWIETNGTLDNPNTNDRNVLKNFLNSDSGVKDHHVSFVRMNVSKGPIHPAFPNSKRITKDVPLIIHRGTNYDYSTSGMPANYVHIFKNHHGYGLAKGKYDTASAFFDKNGGWSGDISGVGDIWEVSKKI